jgi:propanol-preferring alcohol dehydrogenase
MKAFRIHAWQSKPNFEDVAVPEPGPGEVLIKIAGAGVCSSDLHYAFEWSAESMPHLAAWRLPVTLGHENGGWIEGGDPSFEQGTPVVVNCLWHCGNCRFCRTGETNYCEVAGPRGMSGGLGRDGGMAEYMVAPARCVVPLSSIDPADAAPFTDAGLTSYHAVKQVLPMLQPDTTAVVIGVGGLGHLAVEFLRELTGAQIIGVDRSKAALKLAADRGADLCLPSDETTIERIMDATDGRGATAILEMVGIDATLKMAVQCLRHRGCVVMVGIGGGSYPLSYTSINAGASMVSSVGGSMSELAEVIALAEAGRLKAHTTKFDLDEAPEVLKKLKQGEISGRAVLIP